MKPPKKKQGQRGPDKTKRKPGAGGSRPGSGAKKKPARQAKSYQINIRFTPEEVHRVMHRQNVAVLQAVKLMKKAAADGVIEKLLS